MTSAGRSASLAVCAANEVAEVGPEKQLVSNMVGQCCQ